MVVMIYVTFWLGVHLCLFHKNVTWLFWENRNELRVDGPKLIFFTVNIISSSSGIRVRVPVLHMLKYVCTSSRY